MVLVREKGNGFGKTSEIVFGSVEIEEMAVHPIRNAVRYLKM